MDQETILSTVAALNDHIRQHEISDFRIRKLEGDTLCLVGSFDLCYYHDVEIILTGVEHLSMSYTFDVDLSDPAPFSVSFSADGTVVLRFADWSAQETGTVRFAGTVSFCTEHVSYF